MIYAKSKIILLRISINMNWIIPTLILINLNYKYHILGSNKFSNDAESMVESDFITNNDFLIKIAKFTKTSPDERLYLH